MGVSDKQKIIFVSNVFDNAKNGPAMYAQYLWRYFKDHPTIDFHVVAPFFLSGNDSRLHAAGVSSIAKLQYRKLAAVAAKLAKQDKRALIHANASHSVADLLAFRDRLIVQVNDYESATVFNDFFNKLRIKGLRNTLSSLLRYRQERKILKSAANIVCNSKYTQAIVTSRYHLDKKLCRVIYKAVDTSSFIDIADKTEPSFYPRGSKGKRFLFVGSNWSIKGLDTLIMAFSKVVEKHEDAFLTVVGGLNNASLQAMSTLAKRYKVTSNIEFSGQKNRADIANIMWSSDIFVLPSRQEAFGVAVIEAMAAGMPVIASKVGGIPEILDDERYGLLFEAENETQLSEAMHKLIIDHNRQSEMAVAGRQAVTRFSLEAMLPRIESLYKELAKISW